VRGVDSKVAMQVTERCIIAGIHMGLVTGQTRSLFTTSGRVSLNPGAMVLQTARGITLRDEKGIDIARGTLCSDNYVYVETGTLIKAIDEHRWRRDMLRITSTIDANATSSGIGDDNQHRDQVVSPLELVPVKIGDNDNLNAEAVRRALRVVQMHRLLHAPSSTLQNLVNGNTLDMCEFSAQDIKNADELYGPCIICNTVKGVRTAHSSIHKRTGRVGEAIWIDWFITPKKSAPGTLALLDEYLGNAYLWESESKSPTIVLCLLKKLNAELKGYGQSQIVEVLADAGTELASEDFLKGVRSWASAWLTCRQGNLRRE